MDVAGWAVQSRPPPRWRHRVPAATGHEHLNAGTLPIVLAASPPHGIAADAFVLNDFGGSRAAVARLIEHGHRRIGFRRLPAGPGPDASATQLRDRQLRRPGLADLLDVPLTLVTYDARELGRAAAELLCARIDEPDRARIRAGIATSVVDYL